jgi:outer membrane protein assembly factor BamB
MFQHDAQHTGLNLVRGPQTATRQWDFVFDNVTNSGFVETPVVGNDGTIYVGSGTQSTGNLYAITPAGALKWKSPGLGASPTTPAIGSDGTIYVGTEDFGTILYALNPLDGTIRATFPIGDLVDFITLGPNGTLYVIPETGGLFALNPDVSQKWRLDLLGPRGILTPPVASDGTLYVVQGTLTALNSDGSLKWISIAGGGTNATSIGSDGTIYLIWRQAPKLSAVAPSGGFLWDAFIGVLLGDHFPIARIDDIADAICSAAKQGNSV